MKMRQSKQGNKKANTIFSLYINNKCSSFIAGHRKCLVRESWLRKKHRFKYYFIRWITQLYAHIIIYTTTYKTICYSAIIIIIIILFQAMLYGCMHSLVVIVRIVVVWNTYILKPMWPNILTAYETNYKYYSYIIINVCERQR